MECDESGDAGCRAGKSGQLSRHRHLQTGILVCSAILVGVALTWWLWQRPSKAPELGGAELFAEFQGKNASDSGTHVLDQALDDRFFYRSSITAADGLGGIWFLEQSARWVAKQQRLRN
jgi:hypothetical protein